MLAEKYLRKFLASLKFLCVCVIPGNIETDKKSSYILIWGLPGQSPWSDTAIRIHRIFPRPDALLQFFHHPIGLVQFDAYSKRENYKSEAFLGDFIFR
mgnify:CR=1 FL=1